MVNQETHTHSGDQLEAIREKLEQAVHELSLALELSFRFARQGEAERRRAAREWERALKGFLDHMRVRSREERQNFFSWLTFGSFL